MIAKIIASGATRDAARKALIEAVRDTVVLGIATNRERLIQILESDEFATGRIHTGVLDEIGGLPDEVAPDPADLALIVAALESRASSSAAGAAVGASQASDPWAMTNGWRIS
jgi:acetyl/propionyl-CoA carboxylase alpha subunit